MQKFSISQLNHEIFEWNKLQEILEILYIMCMILCVAIIIVNMPPSIHMPN